MARRNQPYLPLYVRDWLTSTKLNMCSARAHGVMISIMCVMHRSENYGVILLKQKFKQNKNICLSFAYQLAKLTCLDLEEIESGLTELVTEGCLKIEGEKLYCPRMVKDAELSEIRAKAGSKGGKRTTRKIPKKEESFASDFAQAKIQANTAIEIENEINTNSIGEFEKKLIDKIGQKHYDILQDVNPELMNDKRELLYDWLEYRKQLGKHLTKIGIERLLKKWKKQNPKEIRSAIDFSIEQGYQGLFSKSTNGSSGQGVPKEILINGYTVKFEPGNSMEGCFNRLLTSVEDPDNWKQKRNDLGLINVYPKLYEHVWQIGVGV